MINIDPWFINPYFGRCGEVNFHERAVKNASPAISTSCSTACATSIVEHGITDTPYVVVKADAGTYGMGVMTVRDSSEVRGLNRKQRNKIRS